MISILFSQSLKLIPGKIISTRCVERGSGSSRAGTLRCSKGIRYRRRRNALEMFLNTLSSIICDLTDPNDVSPQKEGRIDLGETAFALDCLLIEKISLFR